MQGFLRGDVLGYDLSDLPDASQEKNFHHFSRMKIKQPIWMKIKIFYEAQLKSTRSKIVWV